MLEDLARTVLEKLPPERLDPGELADFEMNAAAWHARTEREVPDRSGGYGFGLENVLPEATQLALLVSQTALGVVIEAGARGLWKRLRGRPARQPQPLTQAQLAEARTRVIVAVRGTGADAETAALYADAAVAALRQERGTGLDAGDEAGA